MPTTTTAPTPTRPRSWTIRAHVGALVLAGLIFWVFWATRSNWSPEMRFWKAVGDASFGLLWLTLVLGPLAKLWAPAARLLPWRRQLGIWFAIAATVHALLILDGWATWSVDRFLGYEFVPQLGRVARWEPGFGLANILGLAALVVALLLAATSSDKAMRALGDPAWKYLHRGASFVFYVSSIHALYFLFIQYTPSFHKQTPDPDWFRYWLLGMVAAVAALQSAGFVRMVREGRSASG